MASGYRPEMTVLAGLPILCRASLSLNGVLFDFWKLILNLADMRTVVIINEFHQSHIIHLIERDDGKEQKKNLA